MLIEFSGSDDELADANKSKIEYAVTELLIAHKKGHHLAVMSWNTAKWVSNNIPLGSREKATLERVSSAFTQSAGLLRGNGLHISIRVSHKSGIVQRENALIAGLDDIQGNYFFDRASLVVEDQEADGKLFLQIANACRGKVRAPSIALDIRHGGGERSKDVLVHVAKERRIVLLVTDSDNAHPQKGDPAKILRYRREIQDTGWKLAFVASTPCRELENLIPLKVIKSLPCKIDRDQDIAALESISEIESAQNSPLNESFWWFYDLKKGVDRAKLERVSHDAVREWTTTKIAISPAPFIGFGEKIVPQLLAQKTQLADFLAHVTSNEWWNAFAFLIEQIIFIGFAPPEHRT